MKQSHIGFKCPVSVEAQYKALASALSGDLATVRLSALYRMALIEALPILKARLQGRS